MNIPSADVLCIKAYIPMQIKPQALQKQRGGFAFFMAEKGINIFITFNLSTCPLKVTRPD